MISRAKTYLLICFITISIRIVHILLFHPSRHSGEHSRDRTDGQGCNVALIMLCIDSRASDTGREGGCDREGGREVERKGEGKGEGERERGRDRERGGVGGRGSGRERETEGEGERQRKGHPQQRYS